MDYSAQTGYFVTDFHQFADDSITVDQNIERESTLRIHHMDLQDSMIDPFDAQTDERFDLAVQFTERQKGN